MKTKKIGKNDLTTILELYLHRKEKKTKISRKNGRMSTIAVAGRRTINFKNNIMTYCFIA